MDIDYDPVKNARNVAKHGVSLERFRDLQLDTADFEIDDRRDYGETRYVVTAFLGRRLHVGCFCEREGENSNPMFRVISLRKANKREVKEYEQNRQEAANKQRRRSEGANP